VPSDAAMILMRDTVILSLANRPRVCNKMKQS